MAAEKPQVEEIEETWSRGKRQTMCGKPGGKRVGKKEKDGRAKKEKRLPGRQEKDKGGQEGAGVRKVINCIEDVLLG